MPDKLCSICKESFPATTEYFNTKSTSPDGLTKACSRCLGKVYTLKPKKARAPKSPSTSFSRLRVNDAGESELRCSACKAYYPATTEYFAVNQQSVHGLHFYCKPCDNAKSAVQVKARKIRDAPIRAQRKTQRESERELKKQLREAELLRRRIEREENRLQREALRKEARQLKEVERERKRQVAAKRKREKHRIVEKRYRQSAKGKQVQQAATQKKRARKKALPHTLTTQQWRDCLAYFGYRCAICGRPADLFHVLAQEHWIPMSYEGADNPGTVAENILPMCHSDVSGVDACNNTKSNRNAHEWLVATYGERKAKQIETRIRAYFASVASTSTSKAA